MKPYNLSEETQTSYSENLCFSQSEVKGLPDFWNKYSSILRHTNFVLSVIICTVGLIGNGIVIFATGFVIRKHHSNIWFLNLAIADFVFLLCLPLDGVSDLKDNWPFGSPLCKMYNFLSIANMYASIFIITTMNIDRALAVAKPIWHHKFFSLRARYCICILISSITLVASVPAIKFGGEIQIANKTECGLFNVEELEYGVKSQHFENSQLGSIQSEMFTTFKYLMKCPRDKCCATKKSLTVWNQMVFSTKCLVIPLLVIGYFIPLCVILTSNIIIAVNVRKSKRVKSSRLYRIIITVFIVHLLTWTPLVVAQIILLVAVQNMNVILVFKLIMFLPLLSSISFISLNPIMYVLVGSQVRSELMGFLSRVRSSLSTSS